MKLKRQVYLLAVYKLLIGVLYMDDVRNKRRKNREEVDGALQESRQARKRCWIS